MAQQAAAEHGHHTPSRETPTATERRAGAGDGDGLRSGGLGRIPRHFQDFRGGEVGQAWPRRVERPERNAAKQGGCRRCDGASGRWQRVRLATRLILLALPALSLRPVARCRCMQQRWGCRVTRWRSGPPVGPCGRLNRAAARKWRKRKGLEAEPAAKNGQAAKPLARRAKTPAAFSLPRSKSCEGWEAREWRGEERGGEDRREEERRGRRRGQRWRTAASSRLCSVACGRQRAGGRGNNTGRPAGQRLDSHWPSAALLSLSLASACFCPRQPRLAPRPPQPTRARRCL